MTAPLCFEVSHSVALFCEMLQRVCKAENCQFVSVSWDQTCRTQVTTKMPLKHFNTAGVQILTESLRCAFSAGALSPAPPPELMSQSASVVQPLAPRQAPNSVQAPKPNSAVAATGPRGSWRIPTPSAMTPSSSSSSCRASRRSNSSSNNDIPDKLATAPAKAAAPLYCEICTTKDHHHTNDCPLVFAAACDQDADLISAILASLQEVGKSRPPERAHRYPCLSSSLQESSSHQMAIASLGS